MVNGSTQECSGSSRASSAGKTPAVAFFDLDGTLVVGQTTLLLIRFLRKAGVVSRAFLVGTVLWFFGYKLGLVRVTEKSRDQGARVFKGRSEVEVAVLMQRFTAQVLAPRFHSAAVAALSRHEMQGDYVVVISAALEPVVKAVCGRLGVADYSGTVCEAEHGRYSGRLGQSPHGDEKERTARSYLARWGADPEECWAYADHGSDVALLRSVGHPVAVNPKPELLKVAQREGWPILA
jgi:HAD superfamily hydrolase (TIGR01490 family)